MSVSLPVPGGLSGIIGEFSSEGVMTRLREGLAWGGANNEGSGNNPVDMELISGRVTVGMVKSSKKNSRKNPRTN